MQYKRIVATAVIASVFLNRKLIFYKVFPYGDVCRLPECKVHFHAHQPHTLFRNMEEHRKKVHPGWNH
jgi:hypothetical protein